MGRGKARRRSRATANPAPGRHRAAATLATAVGVRGGWFVFLFCQLQVDSSLWAQSLSDQPGTVCVEEAWETVPVSLGCPFLRHVAVDALFLSASTGGTFASRACGDHHLGLRYASCNKK